MEIVVGIVIMALFVLYAVKKGKKNKGDDVYEQQYWAEKQEEYDNVSVVDSHDDSDD